MKLALVLFMAAAVLPAFFGRIQAAPFWLALQALALGWLSLNAHHSSGGPLTWHAVAAGAEVLLVRGLITPRWLRSAIQRRAEPNTELMPSNLFTWGLATALLLLAFEFGAPTVDSLPAATAGQLQALTLGIIASAVAMALLLLATHSAPPVQLVALLYLENAIALFETLQTQPWPLAVHVALSSIYVLTAGVGAWLIGRPEAHALADAGAAADRKAPQDDAWRDEART